MEDEVGLREPLLSDEDEGRDAEQEKLPLFGKRHLLAIMAFLGFVNVYALRVNLSVAMVAMVKLNTTGESNTSAAAECPNPDATNNTNATIHDGEFDWNSNEQGLILGSFFYGYILTQIPGGWLSERYGGKKLFGFGVLCTSALTLLTPVAARWSVPVLVAVRIIEGIGEGVTFPAMHAIWAKWAPRLERSKLCVFSYAGSQFGTVVSLPISGLLCKYGFAGGWPSVFYVFGALGCLWFVAWMLIVCDTPAQHPNITKAERNHIEENLHDDKIKEDIKHHPTPWLEIFKSIRVWAIIVAHFCNNWGFYTLLTCLPTYMKDVLKFDISENGFLSAIPYLVMWILINVGGQIADYLRAHILSTTSVRKIFNTLGLVIPAALLVIMGYIGCDRTLAVIVLTLAVGIQGFTMSGYNVNHLDIAPDSAGTLMGITNSAATIPGFLGPQVVGLLTATAKNRIQWQKVFYISAAIYTFGAIFYIIFGSGVEQPWAKKGYKMVKKVDETNQIQQEDGKAGYERLPSISETPEQRYQHSSD